LHLNPSTRSTYPFLGLLGLGRRLLCLLGLGRRLLGLSHCFFISLTTRIRKLVRHQLHPNPSTRSTYPFLGLLGLGRRLLGLLGLGRHLIALSHCFFISLTTRIRKLVRHQLHPNPSTSSTYPFFLCTFFLLLCISQCFLLVCQDCFFNVILILAGSFSHGQSFNVPFH